MAIAQLLVSTRWLCLIVTHKVEVEVFRQLLCSSPASSNLPQFSRVSSSIATATRRSFCLIRLDSSMEANSVRFHVLFINCNVWFLGKFQVEYLNSLSLPLSPQTPKVPSLSLSLFLCICLYIGFCIFLRWLCVLFQSLLQRMVKLIK